MFIYKITNKVNGKSYIGQTKRDPYIRWNEHKTRNSSVCPKLKRAFDKYGVKNFSFQILCEVDTLEELNKKEVELIEKYNTVTDGYNIDIGGKNKKRPKEVVEKISRAVKRRSVYQYNLNGVFIRGYKSITEAAIKNEIDLTSIIKCLNGKTKTAKNFQWLDVYFKEIQPISNPMCGAKPKRQICKYDKNMNLLNIYKNAKEAAAKNGIKSNSGILRVCSGKRKSAGGFFWKYKG